MPSMKFDRELVVSSGRDKCWDVLTDVPRLVTWVSIVTDAQEQEPLERYTAVLTDRMGPFKLRADLEITVSDVVPGERIRVQAKGEDRQVASRIGVDAVMVLADVAGDGAGSRISVDGSYEVIGKVATMGAGMIRTKAAKILDEFFAHAATELGA